MNTRFVILIAGLSFAVTAYAADIKADLSSHRGAAAKVPAATRPSNVPDNYVVTPFGFFDPTCVKTVGKGDSVHKDGILHSNGSLEKLSCSKPAYTKSGKVIDFQKGAVPNVPSSTGSRLDYDGFRQSFNFSTNKGVGELTANFTVPPDPVTSNDQTVFFFPALQQAPDTYSILQPVLGWSDGWSMQNWNCCVSNTVLNDEPNSVSAGDQIQTVIQNTYMGRDPSSLNYNISYTDITNQKTSTFNTNSLARANWVYGAVLETYDLTDCNQYPNYGRDAMLFASISVKDMYGASIPVPSSWPAVLALQYTAGENNTTMQCAGSLKITSPGDGQAYRGDSVIAVNGVGDRGNSVQVATATNPSPFCYTTVGSNGTWSCPAASSIPGSHTLVAVQLAGGKANSQAYASYTVGNPRDH